MSVMKKSIPWRRRATFLIPLIIVTLFMGACADKERIRKRTGVYRGVTPGSGKLKSAHPYVIKGVTYYPIADAYGFEQEGIASWYGPNFHGKNTASGERYDQDAMTAAHKTLPLQTMVEVTRTDTGKSVVLRVNDRGPFVGDRIIDLSRGGARALGMIKTGTAPVRVVALAEGRRPSPSAPPVMVKPAPDFNKGEFYVQLGAFSLRANAERLKLRIPFPLDLIRLEDYTTDDGRAFTRVQVGPFNLRTAALEALNEVRNDGYPGAIVIAR